MLVLTMVQIDTSRQVVEWAAKNNMALVDINILAHSDTVAGVRA